MPNWLEIRMFGAVEAEAAMRRGSRAAADARPVFQTVADDMMRIISINFTSQGRRGGGSWKQLDPAWTERKAREGKDPRILFASEALFRAMTHRGDENQKLRVTHTYVELGTTLPYAERQNMTRPFTMFLQSDADRWAVMINDHIMDSLRGIRV